jgi:hypothetical protein
VGSRSLDQSDEACSIFSHELRIAHWLKKENGKPQASDRLWKNLKKYSSPVIEAWSEAL